jgi:hypothetical protein
VALNDRLLSAHQVAGREPQDSRAAWWGYVTYVIDVGLMHWQWKHQDDLRRQE